MRDLLARAAAPLVLAALVHFAFSGILIVAVSPNVVVVALCFFLLKRMRILKWIIESVIWRGKPAPCLVCCRHQLRYLP